MTTIDVASKALPSEPAASVAAVRIDPAKRAEFLRRGLGLVGGSGVFLVMLLAGAPEGVAHKAWMAGAVALLMAIWWILEAVPLAVTSLLPLALFPLAGVSSIDKAAVQFANPLIFMFLGGFVIAIAMERWNLHRRMALTILRCVGNNPSALVGGFMLATAFLSMWVSNTATAALMLPIGLSVISLLADDKGGGAAKRSLFAPALLLGIAYASSIGGLGTLIGTPPNALLAGYFQATYHVTIGFADWLMFAFPLATVLLAIAWLVLTRLTFRLRDIDMTGADQIIEREVRSLGPVSRGEKIVAAVFFCTAACWIFRPLLADWLPMIPLSDPAIAVVAAIVCFVVPVHPRRGVFLLEWSDTKGLPWGVLLLFGGGLSLGAAINDSGLSATIAQAMRALEGVPTALIMLAVALTVMAISHVTSNTAAAAAFLPLVAALAISLGENPIMLAIPAALGASCVFGLPCATPPNAMVCLPGYLTVSQMMRAGTWLNVASLVLIVAFAYTMLELAFGVQVGVVPGWAAPR